MKNKDYIKLTGENTRNKWTDEGQRDTKNKRPAEIIDGHPAHEISRQQHNNGIDN